MSSILVTGSNRGIGLGLIKGLLSHPNPPDIIFATCRDPANARELVALSQKYPILKILKLDVNDVEKYGDLVTEVSSIVGEKGLNILVNNAGVAQKKSNIEEVSYDEYVSLFRTNSFAPVFLTQAFLPLLKKAAVQKSDSAVGIRQSAVINISSILGSLSLKQKIYWGYNESKAAMNQATRLLSTDLIHYGILVLAVHPGWVQTDMGGAEATLSIEESVSGLMKIIYNLSVADNDKFLRYDGTEIPW